jgi:hypothetical protein
MTAIAIDPEDPFAGVAAFLEDYRRTLEAADADALATFYRLPLPVTRPDRTRVVQTDKILREELGHILDFYRWSGMRRVEMVGLRLDGFDPGLALASLSWRPLDGEDREIALIDVTFAIRRVRDGARIAAVIAHNEERHRVPIIRESLSALETPR